MFAVVPLMLLIMLTVLMFHLQSFQRLFMVVAILPLGLIGVVAALLVFGRPLGFVAILGILALIGMIAKNAVILITQIEADRAEGRNVWDAVVAASSSRLRPMSLTAISTVLGLIPIAPTVFWGPMAFAIMGGLLVATMLTLVFLPTVYVTWFRGKEAAADGARRPRRRLGGVVSEAALDAADAAARRSRGGSGSSASGWCSPASGSPISLVGAADRGRGGLGEPASAAARRTRPRPAAAGQARRCASSGSPPSPEPTSRGARSIPRLPLRPGFLRCPLRLAPGPARNAFCAFSSLLPGTLPAGSERDGALLRPLPRRRPGRAGADARRRRRLPRGAGRASAMADLLLAAAGFVLAHGGARPGRASCAGRRSPTASWRRSCSAPAGSRRCCCSPRRPACAAAIDVALALALLAAFASVAFACGAADPDDPGATDGR